MAEAFALSLGAEAASAGTVPAASMNAAVVQVMKEKGLDISARSPKLLTLEMIDRAEVVVTMGCSVEAVCPRPILARMQKNLVEWHIDDPKGKTLDEVRAIRDEVERNVRSLAEPGSGSAVV